jgi:hypothetical protein
MNELGRPKYFNLEMHINAIEGMIRSDEIQIALQMCDQVPGWYRDHYPPELEAIKNTLYRQCYDQIEYATDDEEANCTRAFGEAQWDNGYMFPRAEIISKIIRKMNEEDQIPWIYDLGCSHGNLPLGLIKAGHTFTYRGAGMNFRIQEKVKSWVGERWAENPLPDRPKILYCTEVLEHCFNPHDIVHSAHKIGVEFDVIILSVPMYTLGGGLPDWNTRRIGHVRTWTPKEFADFADSAFRGYQWELTLSDSMVLKGMRK